MYSNLGARVSSGRHSIGALTHTSNNSISAMNGNYSINLINQSLSTCQPTVPNYSFNNIIHYNLIVIIKKLIIKFFQSIQGSATRLLNCNYSINLITIILLLLLLYNNIINHNLIEMIKKLIIQFFQQLGCRTL